LEFDVAAKAVSSDWNHLTAPSREEAEEDGSQKVSQAQKGVSYADFRSPKALSSCAHPHEPRNCLFTVTGLMVTLSKTPARPSMDPVEHNVWMEET
jgi:hypothetical protein